MRAAGHEDAGAPRGSPSGRRSAGDSATSTSERPCHFSGGGRRAFDRKVELAGLHRQLARPRAHHPARDPDEVAQVDEVEDAVGRLPHLVLAHVDLEARLAVARGWRSWPCPWARFRSTRPAIRTSDAERLELLEASCRRRRATISAEACGCARSGSGRGRRPAPRRASAFSRRCADSSGQPGTGGVRLVTLLCHSSPPLAPCA